MAALQHLADLAAPVRREEGCLPGVLGNSDLGEGAAQSHISAQSSTEGAAGVKTVLVWLLIAVLLAEWALGQVFAKGTRRGARR